MDVGFIQTQAFNALVERNNFIFLNTRDKLKGDMDKQAKQEEPKRKRAASSSTTTKRTKQTDDMHPITFSAI